MKHLKELLQGLLDLAAIQHELREALAELKAERAKFEAENIATLLTQYYDQRNAGAYSSKARVITSSG